MANPSPKLAIFLGGGGARASYQVGVLAALAERWPHLQIPILTGVSAGAINTAYLAAHPGPLRAAVRGLQGEWLRLFPDQVYRLPPTGIVRASLLWTFRTLFSKQGGAPSVHGLLDTTPLARFLGRCIDFQGIEANIAAGRLHAVALTATAYGTGRTVTYVHGAADIPIWERAQRYATRAVLRLPHVMASSALPIIFPAVKLDGGFYGDGSVRQTAPLAPAIHLGADRVIAIGMRALRPGEPTATPRGDYPSTAEVIGLLFHSIFLDSLDADAERLDRINVLLRAFPPGVPPPGDLRPVELLMLRPSRDLGSLARGYKPHLPRFVRWVVRGIGGQRAEASDFLSYLLFEPEYTGLLMEMGYDDTRAQWDTIEPFLVAGRAG